MSTNSCHDDIVQTLNWKLSTLFAFECEVTDILCHHDVSTNEVVSLFSIKKKMSRTKCKQDKMMRRNQNYVKHSYCSGQLVTSSGLSAIFIEPQMCQGGF